MKKILIIVMVLFSVSLYSQTAESSTDKNHTDGVGISFKVGKFSKDFSLGLGITSPRFFSNSSAIRINLDTVFRSQNWTPYITTELSYIGGSFMKTADIRLYGGGGLLLVFPIDKSEPKIMIGGQGFFGFEFFINAQKHGITYFIELGGAGISALGKKTNYDYINGFKAHTGFRYYISQNK